MAKLYQDSTLDFDNGTTVELPVPILAPNQKLLTQVYFILVFQFQSSDSTFQFEFKPKYYLSTDVFAQTNTLFLFHDFFFLISFC